MDIISKLKRKILIASEVLSRSKNRHSEFEYRTVFRFDSAEVPPMTIDR